MNKSSIDGHYANDLQARVGVNGQVLAGVPLPNFAQSNAGDCVRTEHFNAVPCFSHRCFSKIKPSVIAVYAFTPTEKPFVEEICINFSNI
jgi:hypothetical protein